jgi:hypothetical protein
MVITFINEFIILPIVLLYQRIVWFFLFDWDYLLLRYKLYKIRYYLTRGAVVKLGCNSMADVKQNYDKFIIECNNIFKMGQKIIIKDLLLIESKLEKLEKLGSDKTKSKLNRLIAKKIILEITYDTYIWQLAKLERIDVRRIFKGPKYGNILKQNIGSALRFMKIENNDPNTFIVPLDFCRFATICDFIRAKYEPKTKTMHLDYIEQKDGKANEDMINTISANCEKAYFEYFNRYGTKGHKQMQRYLRQWKTLVNRTDMIGKPAGIYQNKGDKQEDIIITESSMGKATFVDTITKLCDRAEENVFAIEEIDKCLIICVTEISTKDSYTWGEFNIRYYVQRKYYPLFNTTPSGIINKLEIHDWREGFSSVVLFPPMLREIPDKIYADIMIGKKVIFYYFNPDKFIELCNVNGLHANYSSEKEVNRDRSKKENIGLCVFDNKYIVMKNDHGLAFQMGDGMLSEIVHDWIRPISVIQESMNLKAMN